MNDQSTRPVVWGDVKDLIIRCVANAPRVDRNSLAQALEDYNERFPVSYRGLEIRLRRNLPLDELEEACDARVRRSDQP